MQLAPPGVLPCGAELHTLPPRLCTDDLPAVHAVQAARAARHHTMDDGLLLYIDEAGAQQQARYGNWRLAGACVCVWWGRTAGVGMGAVGALHACRDLFVGNNALLPSSSSSLPALAPPSPPADGPVQRLEVGDVVEFDLVGPAAAGHQPPPHHHHHHPQQHHRRAVATEVRFLSKVCVRRAGVLAAK